MFWRRHEHVWKMGSKTWSTTHGYDDSVEFQICTGCRETRTVTKHVCSNCGHTDTKISKVLKSLTPRR